MYHWQPITQESIPHTLLPWLTCPGNLTENLAKLAGHRFACLSQTYGPIPEAEQALLRQTQTHALIRNAVHYLNEQPAVLARTIISDKLYHLAKSDFDQLGDKPIGQTLLYHRTNITRSAFDFATVAQTAVIMQFFQVYFTLPQQVYARRSLFTVESLPLMVIEFFLPILTHYAKP